MNSSKAAAQASARQNCQYLYNRLTSCLGSCSIVITALFYVSRSMLRWSSKNSLVPFVSVSCSDPISRFFSLALALHRSFGAARGKKKGLSLSTHGTDSRQSWWHANTSSRESPIWRDTPAIANANIWKRHHLHEEPSSVWPRLATM